MLIVDRRVPAIAVQSCRVQVLCTKPSDRAQLCRGSHGTWLQSTALHNNTACSSHLSRPVLAVTHARCAKRGSAVLRGKEKAAVVWKVRYVSDGSLACKASHGIHTKRLGLTSLTLRRLAHMGRRSELPRRGPFWAGAVAGACIHASCCLLLRPEVRGAMRSAV